MISQDPISQRNICTKHESALRKVSISDMKPGKIEKDTILWAKTIEPPYQIAGVMLCLEDSVLNVIPLNLHNQVNADCTMEELNELFPEGTKIGIK